MKPEMPLLWAWGSILSQSSLQTIYVGDTWVNYYSDYDNSMKGHMFEGCINLVGGTGTAYVADYAGCERAQVENGYFTYKGITVTIPQSGIGIFSAAYKVIVPEGLKAYIAPDYESDECFMMLYEVAPTTIEGVDYAVLPANTGYLLRGEPGQTFKLVRTVKSDEGATAMPTFEHNMLVAVTEPTHIEPTDGDGYLTNFMLSQGKFIRIAASDESNKMPANRAYLQIPTAVIANATRAMTLVWKDDTATGIVDIEDPTLTTRHSSEVYDMQGRLVSRGDSRNHTPSIKKGIYITEGKKFVRK